MRRPATNLSVKGRQGEAVRGKRFLSPASDLNAGRRRSVNDPVTKSWETRLGLVRRGDHRGMDNLPDWTVSIIAVAVGLSPGLALLMARPIGRFLRRTLLERRPEAVPQFGHEPVREGPAVAAPPG